MSGLRIPLTGPDGAGTEHALNLLAPNPSEMTLDGTNTWVIGDGEETLVVDPGPDDEGHLARVAAHLEGRRVVAILLTHGHHDHSGGAAAFAALVGAPVRALDPAHRLGEEGLGDGDVLVAGDVELHVVGTPGHSFDSLCFWLPQDRAILTGDTVLGRGTTVIAPDGDLADYLRSLDLLRARVEQVGAEALLPGHGPVLPNPIGALDGYVAHRRRRLDQIRAARERGAVTPRQIVEIVYADVDESLWSAAEMSVRAQLAYLDGL
ncbi:glyoxylase-like metal-dependent hydrolase (beta-lactamase superfamily II) [Streptosporangium becharense]|uniref:Glyoxylase-like metal-dependent hydrolase (Beta-lactamase superfamily II) n=1 Tax=Streptosporangium becharense TaxID=1816182 RepID=A0A7W9MGP0_9ACTN|nr:MBL fold metallo-hydrolase [Streptosporangium becharense]MBB2908952.1 glyoxylase-like metal-dependent hydrolase (beta-lactamase superfamily II) [Streptosporangium becharense]MBB5820030.1 glyoxylase-like metal-dependent hydrolase (beta-lactamase superfamily II) [Streptosporangium becharense]